MLEHVADPLGIILRRDALAVGFNDNHLARARRDGSIVRLRQGLYVLGSSWASADPATRHRMLVAGVLRLYRNTVAASHQSACVLQGGPMWGLELSHAHVTNLAGVGERRAARVTHHRGECRVGDLTRSEGLWVTSPLRTALDTASLAGRDAGVCVLDWYLNRGLVTRHELGVGLDRKVDWPGSLPLQLAVRLCDARSESVGESRTRLLCVDRRLPLPDLQFEVFHPSGRLAGRTDFAWPAYGLLGEFDGVGKYTRTRRLGETVVDAVLREKAREDLLRELTGWRMIRFVWADLDTPAATAARIGRAMHRAAA
ncbi:type IV toxin-antitoxin system AbiEi family antitoxin domain-containing protein [Nocardioides anomalus]|uniref:Type IV toxin-antitoxin system AbiEi family antitoxin domain-containing protein n=1 Tax=Nocardioides anomalus TaxID=2712223 RepID=A0A6G6WH09_9ACTN|nr:type IV toxin-antitoxin system AbiEi family antitoxin domain-containing protein [Nocardioides anomalus]QIG44340.1 type IV toxin-antitoxin system AbiEi family antitoxin domain-containing protein [Nocardioides anomalus]